MHQVIRTNFNAVAGKHTADWRVRVNKRNGIDARTHSNRMYHLQFQVFPLFPRGAKENKSTNICIWVAWFHFFPFSVSQPEMLYPTFIACFIFTAWILVCLELTLWICVSSNDLFV